MAQRTTILTNNDPIIGMVRMLSVVLTNTPAATIRSALNDHAFPRIRLAIMSATKSKVNERGSGSNEGQSIWFDSLKDMADATKQTQVDNLINTMITTVPLIRDAVYSIASKFAASALTNGTVGQVKQQADLSVELERQADADLKRLIHTPYLATAASTVKESSLSASAIPRVYFALDIDDNIATYNATTNEGKTVSGAKVAGKVQIFVGWKSTDIVSYTFPAGTTAAQIVAGLSAAWRSLETSRSVNSDFANVVLAADEGVPVTGTKLTNYKTYPAMTAAGAYSPAITTPLSYLQITPYLYDKSVDFLNVEVALWSESVPGSTNFDTPGVPGIIYGVEVYYSGLTARGPHSVIIDISTGQRAVTTSSSTVKTSTLSDTFYFAIPDPGVKASASVTLSNSVGGNNTFTVTVGTAAYTYTTASSGDTQATVMAGLAALINADTTATYTAAVTAATASSPIKLTVTAKTAGASTLAFAVATTSGSATFISGDTGLSGGRAANTLAADGKVRFRSQELVDTNNKILDSTWNREWSIDVVAGDSVLKIVMAMAQAMAKYSASTRILGALRAPTQFVINGTPYNAPGLTVVPYVRDTNKYEIVFDVLEVPAGLMFAAMPSDLIPSASTSGVFDDKPKSLVVEAKTIGYAPSGTKTESTTQGTQGDLRIANPSRSPYFGKAMDDIRRLMQ